MVKGILINRKSDEMIKNQMKMEHADLIAEMQTVENLPTHERLQLARLRRAQQLKMARQKEKEWLKMQRAKGHANALNGSGSTSTATTHHFRTSAGRHIAFENSVVLLEAASRNDMQEVAELLQHGITPDAANEDGLTALHQCCIDNNVEMLKLLLQYGANVDAQDSDKWTPLHAAATCGHLELVRILIEHGANLLAVNTDGNMPYDLCDDENTLDFIEAEMSKRGVTQELIDETRSSTERQMLRDLMEIARNGSDLEEPDNQGATPLHIAAANGYTRVVEFLLESHVNVDALDKDLWSPVHAAACWGHLEVLEMLAQCGADLNVKNKDDETPSDICEDPEIRERIEQLKTEQESKRLAEQQRRRVRRSQSNNTRAQSVRRTSLRDKTLTTKKDAVEEARLRLQAQEVFTVPDSTTVELSPNGSATNAAYEHHDELGVENTTNGINELQQQTKRHSNEMKNGGLNWTKTSTGGNSSAAPSTNNNIISTNNNKNNNNNDKKSSNASLALNNGIAHLPHSISADAVDAHRNSSYTIPRRPPDGRENDELLLNTFKINDAGGGDLNDHRRSTSSSVAAVVLSERNATKSSAAEAVQIQSSKDAANGKINVQVTVLVDTTSTHHHLHNATSQLLPQPHFHQQQQLETSNNFSGATLANLKKQRSQSRTCVLNENGSVLGAVTNNTSNVHHNNNNNNSIDSTGTIVSSSNNQPMGAGIMNPAVMDYGGLNGEMDSSYSVNKFSGVTGDVVSDSTSSKKCCIIM